MPLSYDPMMEAYTRLFTLNRCLSNELHNAAKGDDVCSGRLDERSRKKVSGNTNSLHDPIAGHTAEA